MGRIQIYFDPFFDRWNKRFSSFLDGNLFSCLFGLTIFASTLAQFPQLVKAITAVSVVGISVETSIILFCNCAIFFLYGIKQRDWRICLAMVISLIELMSIVVITMVRGGSFLGFSFH